jgi:hypothetical protein
MPGIFVDGSYRGAPLLGTVLRSDDDGRAEEARIKGSAQEADSGCLSKCAGTTALIRKHVLGEEAGEAEPMSFSLLDPGSAATDDSNLLLNAEDNAVTITLRLPSTSVLLIAFTAAAYTAFNVAVFALTPTTRVLTPYEHTAVAVTLCIQVASLLHDALSRKRISTSELDTHLCIVVVKALAALTNAMLCFIPATPFILDLVTGRPNSMLRWAEWCVLAFTITFIVEAIDTTEARTPLLVGGSQSLSTFCGLVLPFASCLPGLWGLLLVISFLLYFVIFARLSAKRHRLQLMRASLPPTCYALVRAELGMRLLWWCVFTWTALTTVWCVDALVRPLHLVTRGATDWCFIADCAIDCVAKALYTTAIMEQVDTATNITNTRKESRRRSRLHW